MTDRIRARGSRLALLAASLMLGATLAFAPASFAQEQQQAGAEIAADSVVATVGSQTITEADLAFAAEDLGQELAGVPPAERKAFLLTVLIDMKVMAQAARDLNMDQSEVFKRRLAYLEERALRRAYFAEKISAAVTPEALQAAYDKYAAAYVPQDTVHARHILVTKEEDAKAIKAELDGGASFEELAKSKSIDPGAANGGDLGTFGRGQMVKPFEDAAFGLEVGAISEPVESQFGWHVIQIEGKGKSAPATLEQIGPQLQQQVLFENFDTTVRQLKDGVSIEIPDADLAAAVKAQAEGAQAQ